MCFKRWNIDLEWVVVLRVDIVFVIEFRALKTGGSTYSDATKVFAQNALRHTFFFYCFCFFTTTTQSIMPKQLGRRNLTPEERRLVVSLADSAYSCDVIAEQFNCSVRTIY